MPEGSLAVEASTKNRNDANAKVEKLISESQLFFDSLQAAAQKNAKTVNASVDTLTHSLEAAMTQLEVAQKAIEAANEELHTKVDTRLTQLEAELAVENKIMDDSVGDVHSILLHLLDAHDSILTVSIRRHLAEKLRPALDIFSRIEGVPETSVLPKQGGEKIPQGKADKAQP
uniref:Uncharacterized protein n=1 Tax=Lactuca sativa TaxID=4236 RepID=A0A9R1UWM4_LACSA|nr:hypothetical protein LSAT_V11C700372310 [Lactuca sativa]